jgi:hypothetical protein
MATQAVFVFSAHLDEDIAFSLDGDGANLPLSAFHEPWQPAFRTRLSEDSLSLFRVDAVRAARALTHVGFYVATPFVGEPCWAFLGG